MGYKYEKEQLTMGTVARHDSIENYALRNRDMISKARFS